MAVEEVREERNYLIARDKEEKEAIVVVLLYESTEMQTNSFSLIT